MARIIAVYGGTVLFVRYGRRSLWLNIWEDRVGCNGAI